MTTAGTAMSEDAIHLDVFEDRPSGKSHGGCGSCGSGSAAEGGARCGNGLEKIYPTTAVRFGYMRFIGEFSHIPELKFSCGAKVVIQTQRGIELGEQVSLTCNGCDKSVTRDQMSAWVRSSGEDTYMFNAGRILREATAADLAEFAHIQSDCRTKRDFAQRTSQRHKLPIRIIECECPLGGERIIFYFNADERVDFRAMVKDLAEEYRTRIEMRQIGARDEARLLADFETCGREVCCKVFLKTLRPISMRMAKLQKATLDPTQVSGRCGRLKCCLRYEHTGYEELNRKLPRTGLRIRTNHGEGVVVNRQILTQLVQIQKDDGTVATVVIEDVTEVDVPPPIPGEAPSRSDPNATGRRSGPRRGERRPESTSRGRHSEPTFEPEMKDEPPQAAREHESNEAGASDDASEDGRVRRRRRRRRRRDGGQPGSSSGGGTPPPGA
jgi:cell fate regulator YaaT (PSP1 superfamily)